MVKMKTHTNLQRVGRCQLIYKGGHPEKYLYKTNDGEEEGGGGGVDVNVIVEYRGG